jgi:hypothetical protein
MSTFFGLKQFKDIAWKNSNLNYFNRKLKEIIEKGALIDVFLYLTYLKSFKIFNTSQETLLLYT